jgi:hypothetical protein
MDASTATASSLFGLDAPICPYTGLRTFTEDEAIYFRGRESHVTRCLDLLAEQRFVMITGASGDGKSSLVFAGLLPEVRAGFVRARYGSWAVATFRPERSPLRNLSQALATALRLPGHGAIETELEQGFSALVQLYKTSALCPAPPPPGLTPAEERRHQREAANLLIVVDQFEEFFTNPENYDGETPNTAAQTVVNLLLETTRLAQAEGLPIYIVCTMRSDFVGQCAEFRGLIEQVGASQYFVPRLVRHEFVEVIREPALLSGNRISERLVQRLLYDIGHGQDQLPVLQHALRRIWLAADEGREEMDLLHYAMVGGLSDELPAADQPRFAQWQATLPAQQREFLLASPSLLNVLDAHANQLYAEANELYNRDFSPPLPPGTAERVIEQAFRVLTRTDGRRVVRNRLTGAQITAIIDAENLPWPVVCRILRPFRAVGTTFLSPFLGEDDDDRAVLPPDAVLDLTHESLIRNWQHLARWARAEAADVRVAENFMQQVGRWQASGESTGFLLPIGLYTFFEQWHRGKKGAANWLAYYLEASPTADATLREEQAAAQNDVLTRYLRASRRRLRVPLLVAHYGAWRLAAAVLLPTLLVTLVWLGVRHRRQQSDYVAYSIVNGYFDRDREFQKPPFIAVRDMAAFFINADRLKNNLYHPWLSGRTARDYTFPHMLDSLANDTLALDIELSMYGGLSNVEYDSVARENPYIRPVLHDLERRLARAGSIARPASGAATLSEPQRRVAALTARTIMALSHYLLWSEQHAAQHRPGQLPPAVRQHFAATRQQLLRNLRDYVQQEIQTPVTALPAPSPVAFGFCLRVLLGQGTDSPAELAFLKGMSPFDPGTVGQFNRLFPAAGTLYSRESSTPHSGGYLTASLAFAALRQLPQLTQCLDTMRRQPFTLTDANSGIALVPYLVKYELLTPANTHSLLNACAQVGGFTFNELFAATTYSLLSVAPVQQVFDVSQKATIANLNRADAIRLGGVDPGYLNSDRVSFSVPAASRDKAWAALRGAIPGIARQESIFIESEEHDLADGVPESFYEVRDELFLNAFLSKMQGAYLTEIRHQPAAARQAFEQFSRTLAQLEQHLAGTETHPSAADASPHARRKNVHQINSFEWNLAPPQLSHQVSGTTAASTGAQSPQQYLQLPTRPKTLAFETYYTCSFDAFFRYELQHEASSPQPDRATVQLLDSVAFVEAALPDRYSNARTNSLFSEALSRPAQYRPNLAWIRAIAQPGLLPGNARRRQRNALLLRLSETLQSHRELTRSGLIDSLLPLTKQLRGQPRFSRIPLQVAFSDLAAALAHEGQVAAAFTLADALGEPMTTITKIRASEQAMLTNNQSAQAFVDKFLHDYAIATVGAYVGEKQKERPRLVSGNLLSVFYWRPYAVDTQADVLVPFARRLVNLNTDERNAANDLYAKCIGYSLADKCYLAKSQMPEFQAVGLEDLDYNYILMGWAHLKTTTPGDGWREYDEVELTTPADYNGSVN